MSPHCSISNLSRPCIILRLILKKIYFETNTHKTEFIFELLYIYVCVCVCIYMVYIYNIYTYVYLYNIYIIYIYICIYIV